MSPGRKFLFYLITISFPFVLLLLAVEGYYAYRKLTTPVENSGSYGRLDGELGWALKANAQSRMWQENKVSGETYFDSQVYTDENGFRSKARGGKTAQNAIVTVGDSWTFGYAVHYEETYPGIMAELSGKPVVNIGIPAYGAAQSLLLLERHAEKIKPKTIVYLDYGLWKRSLCHGLERPQLILKPCFWINPSTDQVELIKPLPGHVEKMSAVGVYPGGWLTAGNGTWSYYLISRPIARFKQLLTAAGVMPGHQSEYDTDPAIASKAWVMTLNRFLKIARKYDAKILVVDPLNSYPKAYQALSDEDRGRVILITHKEWMENVFTPASQLPPEQFRVPKDGHFAEGMNRLMAQYFLKRLAEHL